MLALHQQPGPHLICTHAAGGTIFCAAKAPVSPLADAAAAAISVQCVSPAGVMVELTAEGQVHTQPEKGTCCCMLNASCGKTPSMHTPSPHTEHSTICSSHVFHAAHAQSTSRQHSSLSSCVILLPG